jgi:hypothetical protein
MNSLGTSIGLLGVAAVSTGFWLLSPTLGLVAAGAALMWLGYRMGG